MLDALRHHWPEYLIEACLLGLFMLSAAGFGTLLGHPDSPVRRAIASPLALRGLMGLAMGVTAVALIYSPFGMRSGAHMNPSVTLGFLTLGKVRLVDALFYVLFQFLGGAAGLRLASALLGERLGHPEVRYVVTVPGTSGAGPAFLAEALLAFALFATVLRLSSSPGSARFAGLAAGALVALYITFEAPISGMSLNPARTFGSALRAHLWTSFWIYLTAPVLGMLVAALLSARAATTSCAKLHHDNPYRCIFCGKP